MQQAAAACTRLFLLLTKRALHFSMQEEKKSHKFRNKFIAEQFRVVVLFFRLYFLANSIC